MSLGEVVKSSLIDLSQSATLNSVVLKLPSKVRLMSCNLATRHFEVHSEFPCFRIAPY